MNSRDYLVKKYQAVDAGKLYPAVFTGKRGRRTPPSRRLFQDLTPEVAEESDLVYLMLVDGELKYVGYTANTLKERMSGYGKGRFPSTGGTNKHIYQLIMDSDYTVDLLAVKAPSVQQFGLDVSLARSLEYALIQEHDPEWNRRVR